MHFKRVILGIPHAVLPAHLVGRPGGPVLIGEQRVEGLASIVFTQDFRWFDHILFIGTDVFPDTNGVDVNLALSADNGATYQSGAASYAVARTLLGADGVSYSTNSVGTPVIGFAGAGNGISNAAGNGGICFVARLYAPNRAKSRKLLTQQMAYNGTVAHASGTGGATTLVAALNDPVNAAQFVTSAGAFASGRISAYGVSREQPAFT